MMGSSCALQYTVPSARSRFVKPRVELAPRTVQIGFDLSPKGETLGDSTEEEEFDALPNSNSLMRVNGSQTAEERLNFTNSRNLSLIKPASGHAAMPHKRNAASTSPRSALQQLLLAPLTQSEPASTSPAADPSLTYGPLQLHPACNSSHATSSDAATRSSTGRSGLILHSTKPFTPVVHEPAVAAANHNWINSIAGQSRCASSIDDEMKRSQVPWTYKSERERIGKETRRMKELHELPACRGKNTQSGLITKETTIGVERPYSHYHQKSSEVEIIGAKKESTNEKSKKSSLFVFVVSSPAAEYTTHNCLQYESDPYKSSNSMDMDFLNSCHLCKRPLNQGHDVFMYSGDKAFCSMECRYQQIVIDERNARHAPLVIRSGASPVFQNYTTTTTATAAATATTHRPIMINKTNFMNPTAAA